MKYPQPTPETLRKLLRYEPDTGKLFWLERTTDMFDDGIRSAEQRCRMANSRNTGKEALTASCHGYRMGRVNYARVSAHRVIWAMVNGEWPVDQIDHINGVRDDNRIENLREVSTQENLRNQKVRSTNTSGKTGVYRRGKTSAWYAQIVVSGKCIHIGTFSDKNLAIEARKDADSDYGFHQNHGRPK